VDTDEPINHKPHQAAAQVRGAIILKIFSEHFSASSACAHAAVVVARDAHGIYAPWDSAPVSVDGVWVGGLFGSRLCGLCACGLG
jgi:hypothetical protein